MGCWVGSAGLADMLGLKLAMAQRIIQGRHYKNTPLVVRQIKSSKGRPSYQVLWNIRDNKPANQEDLEDETDFKKYPACSNLPIQIAEPDSRSMPDISDRDKVAYVATKDSAASASVLLTEEKANALLQVKDMAMNTNPSSCVDAAIDDEPPGFEVLLHRKVCGKPKATQRSLKAYYTKIFKDTGEVPPALFVTEGRRFSGKKSTLSNDIKSRFIDMVIKSADQGDIFNYYTKDQRKVTVFHQNLEKEFGQKIEINRLYSLVRSCNLRPYLEINDDDEAVKKMPGFFKSEAVGSIIQMDGVEADYVEIYADGKWRKPIWIEFMDLGSRKLLAMHAYLSESSHNSVDIFMRFLGGNEFAHRQMNIRPDQAGGFRNLKRPMHELNQLYSVPDGFVFIDDFARAGTPKDKAHLESSHRAVHKNLERSIIEHFKDKIDSQYKKTKKVGNVMKNVTVTRLNISLDDLNASGMTEAYMHRHNSLRHRFSEDGVTRTWIPDERWNDHLAASQTFKFKQEDIDLCRRYGYEKAKATISKEGSITYLKRKFFVEDKSLWSRSSSTPVKVSLIDDKLAIFKDSDDGWFLGEAKAPQAPVKPQSIIDKEQDKVEKIHIENEFYSIAKLLQAAGMIVDIGKEDKGGKLHQMQANGLTIDVTQQLLDADRAAYERYAGTIAGFNLFASRFARYSLEKNPPKIIPYAGVNHEKA